jgi:hypothetical protein
MSRRAALARLGFASSAVYLAPALLKLSEARASGGGGGGSGGGGGGSGGGGSGGGASGGGTSGATGVSGPSTAREESDYLNARKAYNSGQVKPLYEVISSVRKELGGNVIGVRFRRGGGSPKYELKMVSAKGALVTVTVNARNAKILNVKGRR